MLINCSPTEISAFFATLRSPVKYPARAEESDIAGRAAAAALRDETVRTSSRAYIPIGFEKIKSSTAASVPKNKPYAMQPRISRRSSRRSAFLYIPRALQSAAHFDTSRTAARFTPDRHSVTAKP